MKWPLLPFILLAIAALVICGPQVVEWLTAGLIVS